MLIYLGNNNEGYTAYVDIAYLLQQKWGEKQTEVPALENLLLIKWNVSNESKITWFFKELSSTSTKALKRAHRLNIAFSLSLGQMPSSTPLDRIRFNITFSLSPGHMSSSTLSDRIKTITREVLQ